METLVCGLGKLGIFLLPFGHVAKTQDCQPCYLVVSAYPRV